VEEKKKGTINALLDITNFSGESSGRLMPIIMFFTLAGIPVIVYLYLLAGVLPLGVFLGFEIPFGIRMFMITIGDEGTRLNQFKRQLYDVYSSMTELMDIKTIHEDGMIEYTNGNICYLLLCYNRGAEDQQRRATVISNIIRSFKSYVFDVRVYNMEMEDELYSRYEGVKLFTDDASAAADFLKIIDFNREYATNNSLVSVTVFNVYGRIHEHRTLKEMCVGITKSSEAKVFRAMRVANQEEVGKFLSEDSDSYVSIEEMQIQKYSDGNYYDSKVVGYDLKEDEIKIIKEEAEDEMEGGFLVK